MDIENQNAASSDTSASGVRDLLSRNRFAEAASLSRALLLERQDDRDLLYMLAIAERYQGRIGVALGTLDTLESHHPTYSRLFQEKGHCYVALRSAESAIDAFEHAVALNPALPASWKSLQALYGMLARHADAENAKAHVTKLASLPKEIVTSRSMFADGETDAAEALVRHFLLSNGDHIEGMRLLAQIGAKHDVLDDAEVLLEAVLHRAPDYWPARFDYLQVLLQRHKHNQAKEQVHLLLSFEPRNPDYRAAAATIAAELGDSEWALGQYCELLRESPNHSELHLSVGHTLKTLGRQSDAIEAYRRAATVRRGYGDAYWSLANLKTYRFSDEEVSAMRETEASPSVGSVDRVHLCFALSKALEDRENYAESFIYLERGNALRKQECRYRPEFTERNTRLQMEVCTESIFREKKASGTLSNAPIFVVGLPRSGSTLIEQILASHSQVEGTMELADVPRLVQRLTGRDTGEDSPYPAVLRELTPEQLTAFGEQYLSDTRIYRHGRPRFVDKMPNNFRHIGLIHLMFPNAKIIDARRSAMACCFSNYKQLFASGQQFTYSLEDIARYYRTYVELMGHWDRVLPGSVLRVQHEEMVTNFEGQVRCLLKFCNLDFEPGCLEFHKTRRRVHTASSEQVRRPINAEGLDQWRKFEPWLGPLKEALGDLAGR